MKLGFLRVAIGSLFVVLGPISTIAQTTYTCSGVPQGVSIEGNGHLLVEQIGGLSWGRLCSVSENINGIAAAACKSTYAGLLVAQNSARPVTFWVSNNAGSCTGNAQWQFVVGWYLFRVGG